jgi:hypothetical protein
MGAFARTDVPLAVPGAERGVGGLHEAAERPLARGDEKHIWGTGVCGELAVAPSLEQPPVITAQAIDLLVRAVGAVVLDQHGKALVV